MNDLIEGFLIPVGITLAIVTIPTIYYFVTSSKETIIRDGNSTLPFWRFMKHLLFLFGFVFIFTFWLISRMLGSGAVMTANSRKILK